MKEDNKFSELNLSAEILKSISDLNYKNPTEVQEKVIPNLLLDKDIIVKSQTGSGKTAAFAIPLCEKIIWDENAPQALVLSPTRELAVQISNDFINIGRYKRLKSVAVFGKSPITEQINSLKQRTHVVVGTPGRVLDLIERNSIKLEKIKYLIIDEADEMLNMGFIDQVGSIIEKIHKNRVTALFSATMVDAIKDLCTKYMMNPLDITIAKQKLITDKIEHCIYYEYDKYKMNALNKILINENIDSTVIFGRTKDAVDKIYDFLNSKRYSVNKIHGNMLQKERLEVMDKFKKGDFRILVATDIASRGIDIENITHVINFDLPVEKEAYVHRIGRTGRAGAKGKAISICSKEGDRYLKGIEEYIGFEIPVKELPSNDYINSILSEKVEILKSRPKRKVEKSKKINSSIFKIYLNGGKKKKIRAGDIVGAISKISGVTGDDIGIIDVQENGSYVDILNNKGNLVLKELSKATIKGKKLKIEKARK